MTSQNLKKNYFSTLVNETLHFGSIYVSHKKNKFWVQSVHFWSRDITKHEIYKIGHISAIFKDRDFWFGPKNYIKLCAEHCTALGVIKYISGHVTAH